MLEETIPTISSWFTPTFLFLALNLVIGIIAVTSSFGSKHKQQHQPLQPQHDSRGFQPPPPQQQESRGGGGGGSNYQHPQLVRGPSTVIERLKSINLYHFKTEDLNPFSSIHTFQQPDPEPVSSGFVSSQNHYEPPPPPQQQQQRQPLARAPSILDRLKSINLYHYKADDFNPFHSNNHHLEHHEEETAQLEKLSSSKNSKNRDFLDHRALENKKRKVKVVQQHDTQQKQSPRSPAQKQRPTAAAAPLARAPPPPPQLARAPSILERLKSINLYQDFIPNFQKQPVDQLPEDDHDFLDHRTLEKKKSVTKTPITKNKKKLMSAKSDVLGHFGEFDARQEEEERRLNLTAKEKKSQSMNDHHKKEFSDDEEERAVDEEVDAKADDFINRFKNQLKLQRLDSIMQYKDLLTNKK
ncbi:hypothetical protein C5167_044635 [Papaver somniferum]|uniref:DUF4408 domain-containing protein n=1 Tax=Papaver somniferum TaxID=3469 RepID=A0A4Y7LA04_PAPSO|nr:bromodomain-containing protein 4B-like [Papaver somniferum]RZC82066.1 hypothetical protein C5167_044635 [Papaver somniferum]